MLTKSKFACCEPGKMKASNSLEMLKFTPCQGSRLYLQAAHDTNSQDGDIEPLGNAEIRRFLCWQKLICLERNSSQGDVHICVPLEEDDPVEDQSSSGADSEADHHLTHAGDHFVPN